MIHVLIAEGLISLLVLTGLVTLIVRCWSRALLMLLLDVPTGLTVTRKASGQSSPA